MCEFFEYTEKFIHYFKCQVFRVKILKILFSKSWNKNHLYIKIVNQYFNSCFFLFCFVSAPPPALHNVWVKPSTILANILWEVAGTGGYPIIDFTAEYRLKPVAGEEPEEWKPIIPTHIPPNSVSICKSHNYNRKRG